jgi:cyclic pyranopterin phosphate synthase
MSPEERPDGGVFEDGARSERRKSEQVDRAGRPRMTDLGGRPATSHRAVAEAEVAVSQETLSAIVDGTTPRGDVLGVAELAGVMAAKRTAELIPLAHSASLTELLVKATPERGTGLVRIRAETAAVGPAGVEMEALTAAAIAALTLYDMIRDIDRSAWVGAVRLVFASEGRAEPWQRPEDAPHRRPPAGARGAGRISSAPQRGRQQPPRR